MRNPDPFSLLVSLWHLSELCVYTTTVSPVLGFTLGTLLLPGVDEKVESVVTKSDTFFMAHCQPTNAFHSSLRRVRAEKEPSCVGSGTYLANWFVKFPFQLRLRGMNGVREITFFFFCWKEETVSPEAHITEHKGGQACLSRPNKIPTLTSKLKGFELLEWGPS